MSAMHVQHKLTVLGGALVSDDVGRDSDAQGEETGGIVRVRFHFSSLRHT